MDTNKTADALTTIYWGTDYAGQPVGSTDCDGRTDGDQGPMQWWSQLNLNSSNDLSQIIVGYDGANVQTIQYLYTAPHGQSTINIYGQGPKGAGSGSFYLNFLTAGGQVHTMSLFSSTPKWRTDSFEDPTGIVAIWWYQPQP